MMQTLGLPPAAAHDKGRVNEQSLRGVERKKVNGGKGQFILGAFNNATYQFFLFAT